jgi:hypothetical protein
LPMIYWLTVLPNKRWVNLPQRTQRAQRAQKKFFIVFLCVLCVLCGSIHSRLNRQASGVPLNSYAGSSHW